MAFMTWAASASGLECHLVRGLGDGDGEILRRRYTRGEGERETLAGRRYTRGEGERRLVLGGVVGCLGPC